jgi:hypothetical protein
MVCRTQTARAPEALGEGSVVGVDLDNTILCYDSLFHATALRRALIDRNVAPTRLAVRKAVREGEGGEPAWQSLQAEVYGEAIKGATLYPGAAEFFEHCRRLGVTVHVVSHKTEIAHDGRTELRTAALDWLHENHAFEAGGLNLERERVAFASTLAEKISRIGDIGARYFIDDLPDVLLDKSFPRHVEPIWFAPENENTRADLRPFPSWDSMTRYLFNAGV